MTAPPPTLKSIAELAQVSPMTVSLALRNSPRISAGTRTRVQTIAGNLGYHPNSFATSLVSLRTLMPKQYRGTLALLNCHTTRHGWRQSTTACRIQHGAQQRATELGYTLDEFWFADPALSADRLHHMLVSRGIHGAIFAFFDAQQQRMKKLRAFDFSSFACVAVSRCMPDQPVCLVANDQYHSAALAADHLQALGYRRIGLILNEEIDAGLEHRFRGGFLSRQSAFPREDVVPILDAAKLNADTLLRWIREHRVEAMIALPHDVHHLLREKGITVPDDIGLAYLDWSTTQGGHAGIDQKSELVGAAVVDVVSALIHSNERGIPVYQKTVFIRGEWMAGRTLRPIAAPLLAPAPAL